MVGSKIFREVDFQEQAWGSLGGTVYGPTCVCMSVMVRCL